MSLRAKTPAPTRAKGGGKRAKVTLDKYDATRLVGLRVCVKNAAVQQVAEDGEVTIEIPRFDKLMATVAVCRSLKPLKLRGWEVRAIRKIMRMTLSDLAAKLGERTSPETVLRWESEAQPMGGYVDKLFRLLVCETLRADAPGVDYTAQKILELRVLDPWLVNPDYEVPYLCVQLVRLKEGSGSVIDAWDARMAA